MFDHLRKKREILYREVAQCFGRRGRGFDLRRLDQKQRQIRLPKETNLSLFFC